MLDSGSHTASNVLGRLSEGILERVSGALALFGVGCSVWGAREPVVPESETQGCQTTVDEVIEVELVELGREEVTGREEALRKLMAKGTAEQRLVFRAGVVLLAAFEGCSIPPVPVQSSTVTNT